MENSTRNSDSQSDANPGKKFKKRRPVSTQEGDGLGGPCPARYVPARLRVPWDVAIISYQRELHVEGGCHASSEGRGPLGPGAVCDQLALH